jgi:hypothetical protein
MDRKTERTRKELKNKLESIFDQQGRKKKSNKWKRAMRSFTKFECKCKNKTRKREYIQEVIQGKFHEMVHVKFIKKWTVENV